MLSVIELAVWELFAGVVKVIFGELVMLTVLNAELLVLFAKSLPKI